MNTCDRRQGLTRNPGCYVRRANNKLRAYGLAMARFVKDESERAALTHDAACRRLGEVGRHDERARVRVALEEGVPRARGMGRIDTEAARPVRLGTL